MCFTPLVSLSIAIFEIIIAVLIYKKFNKKLFGVFVFLLGFYQFTEFMLCTFDGNWARLGFITYTFLPALGLHICLKGLKKKYDFRTLYILPVLFSLYALTENFIAESSCGSYFVTVRTMLTDLSLLSLIYIAYYFGFIAICSILLIKEMKKSRDKKEKMIGLIVLLAIFLSLVPPIVLFYILGIVNIAFPSVYCDFAVLFTIMILLIIYLERKWKKVYFRI